MNPPPSKSSKPQASSLGTIVRRAIGGSKPNSTKAPAARGSIIERLFADENWTENYRVSADERAAISNAAMMGEVRSERDVLFILNQLRRARLRW